MENATKALLIAAAVLVAILIISLGLVVYNMAAETVGGINLSEQEVAAHNETFIRYEGPSQRGSQVNAMLRSVLSHNMDEENAGKKVTVYNGTNSTSVWLSSTATSISKNADTGRTYTVTTVRDANSGLITEIHVVQK